MGDVVMVATMVAFIVLCVGYVGWCDRILARDDEVPGSDHQPSDGSEPTALEAVS